MKQILIIVVGAIWLTLSGCASIVSNNESTTYIETDPEVARCELHGQDFKRVITTPTSIHLPAAAAPLTVACKADGYVTTTETLDTSMDGWIFGNIIFGGIIGIAIDAARDSGEKFPPKMTVILQPEAFPTAAERDNWFDNRRQVVKSRWQKVIEAMKNECEDETASGGCNDSLEQATRKRDEELAKLDERQSRTRIIKASFTSQSRPASSGLQQTKPQLLNGASTEERLQELKTLVDKGLLTPAEAAVKRKEILEGL